MIPPDEPRGFRSAASEEAWEERLFDTSLEDALGKSTAPDLALRVVRALEGTSGGPAPAAPAAAAAARRRPTPFAQGAFVGVAAAALLWISIVALTRSNSPQMAAPVVLQPGGVRHRHNGAWTQHTAVTPFRFLLSSGDRLQSAPSESASLLLGDLGLLRLEEASEIEVLTMQWKDFGAGAVLGSVTVGVLAGGLTWYSSDSSSVKVRAGETQVLSSADSASAGSAALREQLEQAKARIRELEARPVSAPPGAQRTSEPDLAAAAQAAPAPASRPSSKLQFSVPELEKTLASIDWSVMGEKSSQMIDLMKKLAEAIANGEEPPLGLLGELQAANGFLVKEAEKMVKGGMPGEGPNGCFTHPLVTSNLMAAIFEQSGTPLSAEQMAQIGELAKRYSHEDALRVANYAEGTPRLQIILEELALKARFHRDAFGALSADQRSLLSPSATQGRIGFDLMGPGIAWNQFVKPVMGADRAQVSSSIVSSLDSQLSMSADQRGKIEAIVSKWTQQFPDSQWNTQAGPLDYARAFPTERAQIAATLQLEMMREILGTGLLDPKQTATLTKFPAVFVPFLK
ncbi:MAG: hypothetical protein JNJ88_06730 [Planctomycetes bacterium]|nr:hypothetical protein [Planctomycetota bacterium]